MDLLYSRYASPLELINLYISQGRFGEFVSNFIQMESERRKEEFEKDEDWKLWVMYTHSMSSAPFGEWKKEVLKTDESKTGNDENMTDADIQNIINGLFS